MFKGLTILVGLLCILTLVSCKKALNSPNDLQEYKKNILFLSFSGAPKTLDPAKSYSEDESVFIAQIYEPPLQYHYLKRPYTLEPLTAQQMPKVQYFSKDGELLEESEQDQAFYIVYDITIKPGIYYQPHPAFARDRQGHYLYHNLSQKIADNKYTLSDFPSVGTRELIADDYIYQIKRLANPQLNSPILGVMQKHILGLTEFTNTLEKELKDKPNDTFLDLRKYSLTGVKKIDRYTYRIVLKGQYPQFIYWLAMSFFAPMPWEADQFYSQKGLVAHNITLEWYPIGTGAFMLTENNPNRRMVLTRNPNFHSAFFPSENGAIDQAKGYLNDAGQRLPFLDQAVFTLEKESIPRWYKFLQGYYDYSAIGSDNFDQAIHLDENGNPSLTPFMQDKKIKLQTSVTPSIYYMGFNMLDPVVGGNTIAAQKLRQAIAIAIDQEAYIRIFLNGRGVSAQGPLPQGIFGYISGEKGINPYVYDWVHGAPVRKDISVAKKLLAEAGYPDGRDLKTGKQLILVLDVPASSAPDDKARFDWLRKEFEKLGIGLRIEATQYNRFQQKVRTGNTQMYYWGWVADYPDPENFLFLLYGPNGKVKFGGENASNYDNAEFNKLFEQMKNLGNTPEREAIIERMVDIARRDTPWVWGFNVKNYLLIHQWVTPRKPNAMANNVLKYQQVNPALRYEMLRQWNSPQIWPLFIIIGLMIILIVPIVIVYYRKLHQSMRARKVEKRNKG